MILRPGALRPQAPAPAAAGPAAGAAPGAVKPAAGPASTQVNAAVPPAPPPAAPQRAGVLQLLSGANAGRQLDLTKPLTTLGKPGVQVAVITRRPQGFFITHVEGANFPIVNGKTLDAQAHALGDHDVIEIAGVKMEFFFKT